MKKLYRSKENRILLGVLGGIGEYFNADAVIIRVAYVLLAFVTGIVPLLLAYFIVALLIPEKPERNETQ